MTDAAASLQRRIDRSHRRAVRTGLLRKEWQEQRWRFFLGTMVLSGLLGGMLRAQLIPFNEATLTVFWPVGIIMVIFLAMGPVASEKSERTWPFLLAQPVSRAEILFAKWAMGLGQLLGMLAIATTVGLLAMWSRGFYGGTSVFNAVRGETAVSVAAWASAHPGIWFCVLAVASTVALCCWYTVLFIILTRARNEFTAAMGGILLTIAVHAWLAQRLSKSLEIFAILNPLAPLALVADPRYLPWLPILLAADICLWIVAPLLIVRKLSRRPVES